MDHPRSEGALVIDHLVYATADLAGTVHELNRRFGMSLSPGGQHVGLGTRNFLADLGDGAYLEVIGPDPEQPEPARPRPFGIDNLTEPRLVTWAAQVDNLDDAVRRARAEGYEPGPILSLSRDTPEGVPLRWRLTPPPDGDDWGGLVPFLIEWGDTPHPSRTAASGLRLLSFAGTHPDVAGVRRCLTALGEQLDLDEGPVARLQARLATPNSETVLR
jgi:hypothetical protein